MRAICVTLFFWTVSIAAGMGQPVLGQAFRVTGTVESAQGERVGNASVILRRAGYSVRVATSADGTFRLSGLAEGQYVLSVVAPGYQPLSKRLVRIGADDRSLAVVLHRLTAASLVVIASVASGGLQTVSSQSAPSRTISRADLAAATSGRLSDLLSSEAAVAPIRPSGGNSNAPFLVALRGPDPAETLVEVDGHAINTGATGSFDLSLIDPAQLQDVELVYGIAPSSLIGPDTIGGAVNVRTLEPTLHPQASFKLGYGSFQTSLASVNATGTRDGIGYSFGLDQFNSQGQVHADGTGSAAQAASMLLKIQAPLAQSRGFAQVEVLDQTTNKDISAALSSVTTDGLFTSFAGSNDAAHQALYALDVQLPLGRKTTEGPSKSTLTVRHSNEIDSQSVDGPAANLSEYFFNYRDASTDDSVQYDLAVGRGTFTAKYDVGTESLYAPYTYGGVTDTSVLRSPQDAGDSPEPTASAFSAGEVKRSAALRYLLEPTTHLHYSAALYDSWFTSFGHSLDPRIGFVWTPTQRTAIRASLGTTFQAPLLTELYVPSPLPSPDANGPDGRVSIGNPRLTADRATEYDVGAAHVFGSAARPLRISADFYRTNLRNSIEQFVPASVPAYTYPINLGDVVYRGIEIQAEARVSARYRIKAEYILNSAFPIAVPRAIQDGTLVPGGQFLGTPLHRDSLSIERLDAGDGLSFGAGLLYEGAGNELNRPPFAVANAHITKKIRPSLDLTLSATNITNVYADDFTLAGKGVPYPGPDGPVPTDAYVLPARSIMLTLSHRM